MGGQELEKRGAPSQTTRGSWDFAMHPTRVGVAGRTRVGVVGFGSW